VVYKLGKSSVTYRVGIFIQQDPKLKESRDARACAVVDFVHVYVDPTTRKAIAMPEVARVGLERILRPDDPKAKL
jgi:acyl-CoA thioester hydrolase